MTFSNFVKQELFSQEMNTEQALAFIHGIISSSGFVEDNKIILKINNSGTSQSVRDLFEQLNIEHDKLKENKNWILIDNTKIDKDFEIKQPGYFFAGVFIGGGSMSDPQTTSYHLELQFYYRNQAEKIKRFLNKYNFNFQLIQRRKNWVIYIKKGEIISDFLRAIQAPRSLMEFEDARIERDFRNNLNRYSNLDIYNQEKLSIASSKHLEYYEYVIKNNLQDKFKENELIFFEIKKKNPFSSLSEIVEILKKRKIIKTRSGLNHWLIKLKKIASEN